MIKKLFSFLAFPLFVVGLAWGGSYYGAALKNHGHTALPGDGGPLTNPVISGTGTLTNLSVSNRAVVSGYIQVSGSTASTITNLTVTNFSGSSSSINYLTVSGSATINGLPLPYENILINGGFDFWQRGTTFPIHPFVGVLIGTYTADRWLLQSTDPSGASYGNVLQTTGNLDTSLGTYALDINIGGQFGSFSQAFIEQRVENFKDYRGKNLTLTCRVKSSVAGVKIVIDDGVSNSTSTVHSGGGAYETMVTTKTISTSATRLRVKIGFVDSNPLIGHTYIASAMLVPGLTSFPYTPRPIPQELALCQRYYTKTFGIGNTPAQNTGNSFGVLNYSVHSPGVFNDSMMWKFSVEMSTTPTIITYSPCAATNAWCNLTDTAASGAPTVLGSLSSNQVSIRNAQAAGDGTGEIVGIHFTAEAEIP